MGIDTHSRETVEAAIRKGLEATARQLTLTSFDWDAAGRCSAPISHELHGGRSANLADKRRRPIRLTVAVPCRKCEACLSARQRLWAQRASAETAAAARTWFGTYTLSPYWHHQMITRLRVRLDRQSIDYDKLGPLERLAEHHAEISKEFTKYFKRIRKSSGARLRYMLVLEQHSKGELSGYPHYHALIHETLAAYPVSWRCLTGQWGFGYTKLNLVTDIQQVRYTCKYISKSAAARIRASLHYGSPPAPFGLGVVPDAVEGDPPARDGREARGDGDEHREANLTLTEQLFNGGSQGRGVSPLTESSVEPAL